DAIIGEDLEGIITSWNVGAQRIFGYTAEEAGGKPISILAVPGRPDEMPQIFSRIRQGLVVEPYETARRRRDGQIIDVSITISPVFDAAGQIAGASKIARDITDRKQAERERALLLEREREARRTAELLNQVGPRLAAQLDLQKLIQEVTDIATVLVEADFGAFFHNTRDDKGESHLLYTLSGASREAFAGFPAPRDTAIFGPTFRGECIIRCDDVTRDPRYGRTPPYHGMPEGHLPVRSYLAAPVTSRSGEVLGGLFFGHEAAGRFTANHEAVIAGIAAQTAIAMDNARLFEQARWARAELTRSNEELRRANRDLEVFAYSASHDLQEPLRNITITAQLLERSWAAGAHSEDKLFLNNILSASRRMSALIRDLLAYTSATRREEGPPPVVDTGRVLAEVLENLRAPIEEAGVRVSSGNLPPAAIHEGRLSQIFQNLIGNAVKYRNQEDPFVHVAGIERDGWCVFSVVDNGIGIEPQYAEQIFGLFKRLHARDQYPGSGIGLGICQRLVEQYGGRIWLERSAPGKGSTFCFSLPSHG
ncbi:MAG TPA: ATP-binding protein, partial [Bryobacteraceae bacterium]|nr:ATP-binding protein [Bryobacteraceae bacterium]